MHFLKGELPVIVCVGTDIVGGDCLGPLVGHMLISRGLPTYVYGSFGRLVTALNVSEVGDFVSSRHPHKKVLAIDSCVGRKDEVGSIRILPRPLYPASASGKALPPIGDYSITATVTDVKPDDKNFSLVRLGFVFQLAGKIADIVCQALSPQLYSTLLI